jgi:hypothetical protein
MALQPPSPQSNVVRDDVGNVVDAMLLDNRVKWIAIVYQDTNAGADRFTITPHIVDPTV